MLCEFCAMLIVYLIYWLSVDIAPLVAIIAHLLHIRDSHFPPGLGQSNIQTV